ncbi:hypothetical protein PG997_007773 [Apiospora hydei]|uniref:Uncharacterized protein n=1 Tax=Apiospora hydei TaxID=1337664 RepID=A0ABR1WBW5_9PEZI
MSHGIAKSITWQLDADMFSQKGWSGYTCRHRRDNPFIPLGKLDSYAAIEAGDRACREQGLSQRHLTVLLMAEYPARLSDPRKKGLGESEEYLLTAFMASITILHECTQGSWADGGLVGNKMGRLAHAVYWRDFRSLSKDMREPYYGADLEMELGESFIAHLFGGYVPVPVKGITDRKDGLAWKQFLSWDCHRPPIAAIYTIGTAIAPRESRVTCCRISTSDEGWKWNRRSGAPFRIPQYDDYICPDLSLPIAPEYVMMEPQPRRWPQDTERLGVSSPPSTINKPRLRQDGEPTAIQAAGSSSMSSSTASRGDPVHGTTAWVDPTRSRSYPEVPRIRFSGLDKMSGCTGDLMGRKPPGGIGAITCELTVDELKKGLSHLIGVSLCELETLFDDQRNLVRQY